MEDENKIDLIKSEEDEVTTMTKVMELKDRLDLGLDEVIDVSEHDKEMDDISNEAMSSYNLISQKGLTAKETVAPKMFEVAANMLRISLDAKNAKVETKMNLLEKQLKMRHLDILELKEHNKNKPKITQESEDSVTEEDIYKMDRNTLMKFLDGKE